MGDWRRWGGWALCWWGCGGHMALLFSCVIFQLHTTDIPRHACCLRRAALPWATAPLRRALRGAPPPAPPKTHAHARCRALRGAPPPAPPMNHARTLPRAVRRAASGAAQEPRTRALPRAARRAASGAAQNPRTRCCRALRCARRLRRRRNPRAVRREARSA